MNTHPKIAQNQSINKWTPTKKIATNQSTLKLSVSYHPKDRDEIRVVYLQKGTCQPIQQNFPQRVVDYWVGLIVLDSKSRRIG